MKHRFLWLLVPVAAWAGYTSAPPVAIPEPARRSETGNAGQDPSVLSLASSLENAGPEDLGNQLEELLADNSLPDWEIRMKLLCARWAEVDPARALTVFEESKVPWVLRGQLLVEWALLDSEAAWNALPAGADGEGDRQWIAGKLLNEDPETFMWWFRRVGHPMPEDNPAWLAIAERHGEELEAIAASLLVTTKPAQDGSAVDCSPIYRLLATLRAGKDPSAALDWARKLDPLVRDAALRACLEKWSESEPLEVWKRVTGGDPLLTSRAVAGVMSDALSCRILTRMAKADPEAAMKLILESPDHEAVFTQGGIDAMRQSLPQALASGKLSPSEAYRLINSATGSKANLGLNVLPHIWRGLSAGQLESAAREISAEPNERQRDTALGGIANAWMKKDPAAAIAFISGIKDSDVKEKVYAGCFTEANGGQKEARQTLVLLESFPPEERALAFAAAMDRHGPPRPGDISLSGSDRPAPESAGAMLAKLPASENLTRATTINAIHWGQLDPGAALEWADQLTDPAARQAAFGGTFEGWAYHDPFAAADWITRRKPGPERDAATLPVVRKLAESDPASAWEWAGSIGDADLQMQARSASLQAWSKADPAAAQAAYQKVAPKLPRAAAAKLSECLSGS